MQLLNNFKTYLSQKNHNFQLIGSDKILFDLKVISPNGKRESFSLEVIELNELLCVKEVGNKLPDFCPNRHINSGGYFCLGLEEYLINLNVEEWFILIKDFLKRQISVTKYKVWPSIYPQWSHGELAAKYQKIVEDNLKKINFKELGFEINELHLQKKENKAFPNEAYYFLYHGSKLILMSFNEKVHNKRNTCICTKVGKRSHITIGKCKKQCAKVLFNIAYYEEKRIAAEEDFWTFVKSHHVRCCNTMNECGLK